MGVKCSLSLWRKQKQRARPGTRPHKGAHSPAKLPTLEVPDTGAQRALYSDGALELESHGGGWVHIPVGGKSLGQLYGNQFRPGPSPRRS